MNLKPAITFLFTITGLFYHLTALAQTVQKSEIIKFDDTRKLTWSSTFKTVEIPTVDGLNQKAYLYKTTSKKAQPLIVSLHTWSGNYEQKDEIAQMAANKDYNYIHPDFRGANNKMDACCSDLAMLDIDKAIDFAIANANVDPTKIFVIGVSGGGFATLNVLMRSKHAIKKLSAWAAITDLQQWYKDSKAKGDHYWKDVLLCTSGLKENLNITEARKRSPLFRETPLKIKSADIEIYAGVNDGVDGSVPFTHSIHFYNKLLNDLKVKNKKYYVSKKEIKLLIKFRKPLGDFGQIGDRAVCLIKQYKNIKLTIFTGGHEMLTAYAFDQLTN